MKTIMIMLAFGGSVAMVNASLVPDKIEDRSELAARDATIELVMISQRPEGMVVSRELDRTEAVALVRPLRTFANLLDRPQETRPGPARSELLAISGPHDPLTVSQEAAQAANIAVPEPATIFAGAPLLLPFLAGTVRFLRQNKIVKHLI